MNRAFPADIRKALDAANNCAREGIMFIPVPVFSERDKAAVKKLALDLLEQAAAATEAVENTQYRGTLDD